VKLLTADGQTWNIVPEAMGQDLFRARFPAPAFLQEVVVNSCAGLPACDLHSLTLFDERDDAFQSLVPGDYRMIHSGDVKIYENLDVMPRAFVVYDWRWVPDREAAGLMMLSPDFDFRTTAVVVAVDGEMPQAEHDIDDFTEARVEILQYSPERVVIETHSVRDGLLMLTDAYYPGWEAHVDGQHTVIYEADGLFRGVHLPAGQHEVVFVLESESYTVGRVVTVVTLMLSASLLVYQAFAHSKRSL
jgi:hypothetical protein